MPRADRRRTRLPALAGPAKAASPATAANAALPLRSSAAVVTKAMLNVPATTLKTLPGRSPAAHRVRRYYWIGVDRFSDSWQTQMTCDSIKLR